MIVFLHNVVQSRDGRDMSVGEKFIPAYAHELPLTPHVERLKAAGTCLGRCPIKISEPHIGYRRIDMVHDL